MHRYQMLPSVTHTTTISEVTTMVEAIRLFHLADLHIGFSGPQNLVFGKDEQRAGRFVREVDIELAVRAMVRRAIEADPPVDAVLIAGDLFHRPVPWPRPISVAPLCL